MSTTGAISPISCVRGKARSIGCNRSSSKSPTVFRSNRGGEKPLERQPVNDYQKGITEKVVPARHGSRHRTSIPGRDGSGAFLGRGQEAARPADVHVSAERHRYAQLEPQLYR